MYRIRTAITGGPGGSELSTMYFNSALTFTAQDAANAVRTFWNAIKGEISSVYTFQVETAVTEVADFTGEPIGVSTVTEAAVVGSNVAEQLPPATQALIRLHTGVYYGGRELQGKIYVPGFCENNSSGGVPSASSITTLANATAAMIADVPSELMLFSRKHLNANGVTSYSVWNQFAVLRSRRS